MFGDVVHLRADNGAKRLDHLHALRVKALCEPPLLSLGVEGGDQIVVDHKRVSAVFLQCASPISERFLGGNGATPVNPVIYVRRDVTLGCSESCEFPQLS